MIDLGDITTARGTEMLLPIWIRLMGTLGTPMFNFKIGADQIEEALERRGDATVPVNPLRAACALALAIWASVPYPYKEW